MWQEWHRLESLSVAMAYPGYAKLTEYFLRAEMSLTWIEHSTVGRRPSEYDFVIL